MKGRPSWFLLWFAVLLIIFWFFTAFNPWKFWWIINVLLWIALIFSGISSITNAIKNTKAQYVSFLFAIGILVVILWFMLVWAREANFVGKLMIWMFALWAFMRWGMLIFFWIQNKNTNSFRWWISGLGCILVLLAIMTAISATAMANLVWIFIGISIIFDGFSLLFFALKWNNSAQIQIITQSSQDEIAQWDVVITETVITSDSNSESKN